MFREGAASSTTLTSSQRCETSPHSATRQELPERGFPLLRTITFPSNTPGSMRPYAWHWTRVQMSKFAHTCTRRDARVSEWSSAKRVSHTSAVNLAGSTRVSFAARTGN
jgi:hypothetical protein